MLIWPVNIQDLARQIKINISAGKPTLVFCHLIIVFSKEHMEKIEYTLIQYQNEVHLEHKITTLLSCALSKKYETHYSKKPSKKKKRLMPWLPCHTQIRLKGGSFFSSSQTPARNFSMSKRSLTVALAAQSFNLGGDHKRAGSFHNRCIVTARIRHETYVQ